MIKKIRVVICALPLLGSSVGIADEKAAPAAKIVEMSGEVSINGSAAN